MEKSWKNSLQEYCQKNKLPLPNYRVIQSLNVSNKATFQVEVDVNGRWYIGEENCVSKKVAEHSAAQKAYTDLLRDHLKFNAGDLEQSHFGSVVNNTDPTKHMPPEYADIEEYIADMVEIYGGHIQKVRPPDARGQYKLVIGGKYRYCENVKRHHKKNQVYFLLDPSKKVYYQKCYDPDCQGFQSAKQLIYTKETTNNQQVTNLISEYLT